MTNLNNEEKIDEVQSWGRSLIASGLLVIMLVLTSTSDWSEAALILWIGIVMIWGGWCLSRDSDKQCHQISDSNK